MTSTAAIRFQNIQVTLGQQLIYQDLTFEVYDGEFLCILGPSGCGKSTSLRIIGDLLTASSGEVSVFERSPAEAWQDLAYVFQAPRLTPWRNALKNVMLAMELRFDQLPRAEMENKARELLALVGLSADMNKYPRALSGGERQRVAIARALAVEPRIILMDEPFSALDLNTRQRMREEIISIWRRTEKTIVFVTHDVDEALVLADRVILLSNKPTQVLETLSITAERPRDLDADEELRRQREHLRQLFRQLESNN